MGILVLRDGIRNMVCLLSDAHLGRCAVYVHGEWGAEWS